MFVRTSLWSGPPQTLEGWAEHAAIKMKALVESLAGNVGYVFLLDRGQGPAPKTWPPSKATRRGGPC